MGQAVLASNGSRVILSPYNIFYYNNKIQSFLIFYGLHCTADNRKGKWEKNVVLPMLHLFPKNITMEKIEREKKNEKDPNYVPLSKRRKLKIK